MLFLRVTVLFLMICIYVPLSYGSDTLDSCIDDTEIQLLYDGQDINEARVKATRICELRMKSDKSYQLKKVLKKFEEYEINNAETYLCKFDSGEKKSFRRVVGEYMYNFAERDIGNLFNEGFLILEENDHHLTLYDNSTISLKALEDEKPSYIADFIYINKVAKKAKWITIDFFEKNYFFEDNGDCRVFKNNDIDGKFEELGFGDYQ